MLISLARSLLVVLIITNISLINTQIFILKLNKMFLIECIRLFLIFFVESKINLARKRVFLVSRAKSIALLFLKVVLRSYLIKESN